MEQFTDKYLPIRILFVMRQAYKVVLNRKEMVRYEEFEREKLRRIH
jgi:hypothetical protein